MVAGALRRADPDLPEEQVLMRALRDFNVPKITTDDLQIFLGPALVKDSLVVHLKIFYLSYLNLDCSVSLLFSIVD